MKKIIALILVLVCSFSGYAQKSKAIPAYFPKKAENSWYSMHLQKLEEPVLFNDISKKEIYRFIWLRTFHHPVAIRIEKNDTVYTLYWKMCDGAGGYDPGKLVVNKSKLVTKKEWDSFTKAVKGINFWNIQKDKNELFGTDGSQWILEGKQGSRYHVVDAWTPGKESSYYRCCDYLIGLTDLKIPSDDKY